MANKTVNTTEETDALYDVELKRIALISERLTSFMKNAVNKYPSNETRKLNMVADLITEIIEKTNIPRRTINRIIVSLKEKEMIDREGSNKGGHWKILK